LVSKILLVVLFFIKAANSIFASITKSMVSLGKAHSFGYAPVYFSAKFNSVLFR